MALRKKVKKKKSKSSGGLYFVEEAPAVNFIDSGSSVLNRACSGGWPLGRMVNIIGDKSTGKTLLAIEGCANFARKYKAGAVVKIPTIGKDGSITINEQTLDSDGLIWYRETESAFDKGYAEAIGMPIERTDFGPPKGLRKAKENDDEDEDDKPKGKKGKKSAEEDTGDKLNTVEDFARDLRACCKEAIARNVPGLYILDSMDALSDDKEVEREFGDASFGTGKSKANSELFRRLTRRCEKANVCVIIISQIRQAIGVTFGDKTRRSGGNALDFYATLILKLAHLGRISVTKGGIKREVGVRVRAKVTKNKIGMPFREAEFQINFGFGINDAASCLDWLIEHKLVNLAGLSDKEAKTLKKYLDKLDRASYEEWSSELRKALKKGWRDVEERFLPAWSKYGSQ